MVFAVFVEYVFALHLTSAPLQVTETGMYVVLMANCDSRNGALWIGGHSEWMNPYGKPDKMLSF